MTTVVNDTGAAEMEYSDDGNAALTASQTVEHTALFNHRMPPVHCDGGIPYVLISDIAKCEQPYVSAMNFLGACPVPEGMTFGHHAYYVHDYMLWHDWRMAQGDDWREQAKAERWYAFVDASSADP